MLTLLEADAPSYGVHLTDAQLRQFETYLQLLDTWSERANLVGDADPGIVQRRHFLESIALGGALRDRDILRSGGSVIDVGAGAGFPGVVLKMLWPSIGLTLLEATAKKTAFLAALIDALVMPDVRVLTGRAETLAHDGTLRERFDVVTARAVAPLPALLELTLPFARVGGFVVTPKGSRANNEAEASKRALRVLGAKLSVVPFAVPGPAQKLVVATKQRATPAGYPRRAGIPNKSPL